MNKNLYNKYNKVRHIKTEKQYTKLCQQLKNDRATVMRKTSNLKDDEKVLNRLLKNINKLEIVDFEKTDAIINGFSKFTIRTRC